MTRRGGIVYIAPLASHMPSGRMVDPETSSFHVHWEDWDVETQTGELLADGGEMVGAEAAIAWGRERSNRVLIRLAHTTESYFSAGRAEVTDEQASEGPVPTWPPDGPPPEGWWSPSDEAAAEEWAMEEARHRPVDPRRLGISEPEIRIDPDNGGL